MEYEGPPCTRSSIHKFIVIGDDLRISESDNLHPQHLQLLAEKPGLDGDFLELIDKEPEKLDAGFVIFDQKEKKILLSQSSERLGLPIPNVAGEARERSVTLFERKTPGYEVIAI